MAALGKKLRQFVKKLGIGKKLARRGCFAVYVGEDRGRREIPVKYLHSIVLQALLNQCRDQSECTRLYLCCSPGLLDLVLELAKAEAEAEAEAEDTDHDLAIKNDVMGSCMLI